MYNFFSFTFFKRRKWKLRTLFRISIIVTNSNYLLDLSELIFDRKGKPEFNKFPFELLSQDFTDTFNIIIY